MVLDVLQLLKFQSRWSPPIRPVRTAAQPCFSGRPVAVGEPPDDGPFFLCAGVSLLLLPLLSPEVLGVPLFRRWFLILVIAKVHFAMLARELKCLQYRGSTPSNPSVGLY